MDIVEIDAENNVEMMLEDMRRKGSERKQGNVSGRSRGSGVAFEEGNVGAVDVVCATNIFNCKRTVANMVVGEGVFKVCLRRTAKEAGEGKGGIGRLNLAARELGLLRSYGL